jgi:hypothetical protein
MKVKECLGMLVGGWCITEFSSHIPDEMNTNSKTGKNKTKYKHTSSNKLRTGQSWFNKCLKFIVATLVSHKNLEISISYSSILESHKLSEFLFCLTEQQKWWDRGEKNEVTLKRQE